MSVDKVGKACGSALVERDGALDMRVAVFDALEAVDDLGDGLGPFGGVFLKSPQQEPVEIRRDGGLCGVAVEQGVFGFALEDATQEFFEGRGPFEIMVQGEEFVKHDKQAVDIAAFVEFVVVSEGLFGGHIHGRTEQGVIAGLEQSFAGAAVGFEALGDIVIELIEEALDLCVGRGGLADALGDPPVHHDNLTKGADHDVGGLEISVDHPVAVGELHRTQDLHTDAGAIFKAIFRVVFGVSCLEAFDDVFDRHALDMLHHKVISAFFIDTYIVDRDDVGVFEAADGADLFGKTQQR